MRHQLRPSIDNLENKTLLSHLAAGLMAHHRVHQAEVERPVNGSAMAVSLTTNQTSYSTGQIVQMTLTITNTSNHDETILLGPSRDPFVITQGAKVIWRSDEGFVPQYIAKRLLKPGQSATLTAQWTVPAAVTGTFVVHNQIFPSGPTATFNVTTTPTSPIPPTPISPTPISPTPILPILPILPRSISPRPIVPILPILPILPTPVSPTPTSPMLPRSISPRPIVPILPILPILPTPISPTPTSPILPTPAPQS
jgi:Intracellular proteinase inhibitor